MKNNKFKAKEEKFVTRQKRSFYCDLCFEDLTSVETKKAHVKGKAHNKRLSNEM